MYGSLFQSAIEALLVDDGVRNRLELAFQVVLLDAQHRFVSLSELESGKNITNSSLKVFK